VVLEEGILWVTKEKWANCCQHLEEEEDRIGMPSSSSGSNSISTGKTKQ
jgi:hypothetical protein